ncbi:MAG: NapC/NirT family cytochrome c [Acidobacteria bacterium]|nr:NapC/NirT family cytochrome c [Acidobacteriota bacterium]
MADAAQTPESIPFPERLRLLASPVFYLSRNTISLVGVVLTTGIFLTMVVLYVADFYGFSTNPYVGIVAFLILPGLFVTGLLLIPVGMALKHHDEVRRGVLPAKYPRLDFNRPELRRVFHFVVLATGLNAAIFIHASYRGVQYMDSVSFCGQVCHSVMQPEFAAYEKSPHARVECVSCHIGPGASWFVRYKLSGVRQVFAVTLNTFPRPIPTPIKNLRPARETCEQCHWPSKFSGGLLAIRPKFADDETNTATKTVLMLKVGGGTARGTGIHSAHLDLAGEITYLATDTQRQIIPWVRYRSAGGVVTEYATPDWDGNFASGELRTMDCMDCHNRPTHAFQLPQQAVDEVLDVGRMDASLPFVKKKAVEFLQQTYETQAAGLEGIRNALLNFYQQDYPQVWERQRESIELAAQTLQDIYSRNIFPEMKIGWGTYPNNIGHTDFPGCFRCHDSNHASQQGTTITQDCNSCHLLLAVEEPDPPILQELTGLEPPQPR